MRNSNFEKIIHFMNNSILQIVKQLSILGIIICVVTLFSINYVRVDRNDYVKDYRISPFAIHTSFEETEIFNDFCMDMQKEILRLVVIREQLEEDGIYDGSKCVSINEFVNRKKGNRFHKDLQGRNEREYVEEAAHDEVNNSQETIYDKEDASVVLSQSSKQDMHFKTIWNEQDALVIDYSLEGKEKESLTEEFYYAQGPIYRLEDLIKWGMYGFDYEEEVEFRDGIVSLLEERYQTIEGHNLVDYATSVEDYQTLVNNLTDTIESITYNYNEYDTLNKRWSQKTSNVSYYIRFRNNEGFEYYTNIDELQSVDIEQDQLLDYMQKKGHYLFYAPEQLTFETNTRLTRSDILSTIQNYDYFYPEDVSIWVGIDTVSYAKEDILEEARREYNKISNCGTLYGSLGLISLIVFFVCITLGTIRLQSEKDENLKERFQDKIPIEFIILFTVFILYIWASLVGFAASVLLDYSIIDPGKPYRAVQTGGIIWGYIEWILFLYYSIVRRVLLGNLFTRSLCNFIYRGISFLIYNGNIFLKVAFRFFFYIGGNLMLIFFMAISHHMFWKRFWILALIMFNGFTLMLFLKNESEKKKILSQIDKIRLGDFENTLPYENMSKENALLAQGVNNISEGIRKAVDKSVRNERLKTDLITNVSHDIKTPLTSIINYVDLLKREHLENERAAGYVEVLESKSQRLKQLTDDLVEASKITSGNITFYYEKINLAELLYQAEGEFADRFMEKNLNVVMSIRAEDTYINADSRRMWRVIENLLSNIYKYAMHGTRVYIDMENKNIEEEMYVTLSMKNISEQPLNINADELTERFIRGDVARSTEGSGLGLSIAQSLTVAQGGKFEIYLDGDLFKTFLQFKTYE